MRFQTDGLEKQILQVCSAWTRADGEEGMAVPLWAREEEVAETEARKWKPLPPVLNTHLQTPS